MMYQPIRNYGGQERRSCAPVCVCCLTLFVFVLVGLTLVPLLSNGTFADTISMMMSGVDDAEVSLEFAKFVQEYDKSYETPEIEAKRKEAFALNYRKIVKYNQRTSRTVTLGVNKFADLTDEEFDKSFLSSSPPNPRCTVANSSKKKKQIRGAEPNPTISIDWVKKGMVPPPKDQGQCGSCWTFAATSVIETIYQLRENKSPLVRLAEQQIVDCCRSEYSRGCRGGLTSEAFEYVAKTGIARTADYPYHAMDEQCKESKVDKEFKIDGYKDIDGVPKMEEVLMGRTIAVGVSAGYFVFRFYKSGVVTEGCLEEPINHGVVVVGADTDEKTGLNYWLVRNSWGANWGDSGYLRIGRNGAGTGYCGINACAQYVEYKEPK